MDQAVHNNGNILTFREMRIINRLPSQVRNWLKVPPDTRHLVQLEYSIVNPMERTFRFRSVNREFRSFLIGVDEVCRVSMRIVSLCLMFV